MLRWYRGDHRRHWPVLVGIIFSPMPAFIWLRLSLSERCSPCVTEEDNRSLRCCTRPCNAPCPQFAHWTSPAIFSDTKPFLSFVARELIPLCIVSNVDRVDLEQAISFHDLHFEHIVTSDDVQFYKLAQRCLRRH